PRAISTAVLGLNNAIFTRSTQGFKNILRPAGDRATWDAGELLRRAHQEIVRHRGRRHYMWMQLVDADAPGASCNFLPTLIPDVSVMYGTYREQLRRIDAQLGQLFADLRSEGLMARTAIIVTGDHGESFGEHGIVYHHVYAYEQVAHVPGVL